MCQNKVTEKGFGNGVLVHDLARAPDSCSLYDFFMVALAWINLQMYLKIWIKNIRGTCIAAANSLVWIENEAKTLINHNFLFNQEWRQGAQGPFYWMTCYLMLALWREVIFLSCDLRKRLDRIDFLTENILKRQLRGKNSEQRF